MKTLMVFFILVSQIIFAQDYSDSKVYTKKTVRFWSSPTVDFCFYVKYKNKSYCLINNREWKYFYIKINNGDYIVYLFDPNPYQKPDYESLESLARKFRKSIKYIGDYTDEASIGKGIVKLYALTN